MTIVINSFTNKSIELILWCHHDLTSPRKLAIRSSLHLLIRRREVAITWQWTSRTAAAHQRFITRHKFPSSSHRPRIRAWTTKASRRALFRIVWVSRTDASATLMPLMQCWNLPSSSLISMAAMGTMTAQDCKIALSEDKNLFQTLLRRKEDQVE